MSPEDWQKLEAFLNGRTIGVMHGKPQWRGQGYDDGWDFLTEDEIEALLNLLHHRLSGLMVADSGEQPPVGTLLGYSDDGSEVRTVEKPPLGPKPDWL